MTDFFDEAIKCVINIPIFFEWFESEDQVKDNFCQFDFLVGCRRYLTEKFRHFPNFARYYQERQRSLWNSIESDPRKFKLLLGDDPLETIKQVVTKTEEIARRNFKLFHNWL